MLHRIRLMFAAVGGSAVVLLALCLGAQNPSERVRLEMGVGRSAPLPSGFLVGMALVAGLFSGGVGTAMLLPEERS